MKYYEKHGDDPESEHRERMETIRTLYEQIAQWEEQIKEIRESVRCPQCGAMVPAASRFCNECGHEMGSEAREQASAGLVCPSCGTAVVREMKFCLSCGAKLSFEEPAPAPAEEPTAPDAKCPVCGTPVDASMQFCVACGTKLKAEEQESAAD